MNKRDLEIALRQILSHAREAVEIWSLIFHNIVSQTI